MGRLAEEVPALDGENAATVRSIGCARDDASLGLSETEDDTVA